MREQLQHTLEEEEDGDYHDMHFPIPSHPQSTPARFLVCGKVYMASGLPKDTFWPTGEAGGKAMDLQHILPSLHYPHCSLNGLSNPFLIFLRLFPSGGFAPTLLVIPSGRGFPPLLSFFKVSVSFPDLLQSGYGSPQSLLCWQPFAMFYLFCFCKTKCFSYLCPLVMSMFQIHHWCIQRCKRETFLSTWHISVDR